MSDSDIGPGDVVERVDHHRAVDAGTRAIVLELIPPTTGRPWWRCTNCGAFSKLGLVLSVTHPVNPSWCPNHWRKIGGSRADTVRRFAEDLTPAKPKVDA